MDVDASLDEAIVSELSTRGLVADTRCQAPAAGSELTLLATLDDLDKFLATLDELDETHVNRIDMLDSEPLYDCDATSIYMSPDQYSQLAAATSVSIGAQSFSVEKIEGLVIISESDRMVVRIEACCK